MKKAIVPLILVASILAAAYSFTRPKSPQPNSLNQAGSTQANQPEKSSSVRSSSSPSNPITISRGNPSPSDSTQESDDLPQVKPAGEAYASAEEAMEAVLKGSRDYDDSILEQFTQPGPECSWCLAFYDSAREKATNPSTPQEQRAYLAEILAISGKLENVQTLAESIKMARSNDEADLYAEALELSLGNDEVVRYLGDQMVSPNDTLREASVAAVTNQGTVQSVELLSKHVKERGDPDGYYSSGIGPAELIPDEDALPAVQELIHSRDDFSHLWVKSALNAGMPGLRIVMAELETSPNPAFDDQLLKDAMDHVNLEDGLQEFADETIQRNKSPSAVKFAKKIKEEFSQQEDEASGGDS